MCDAILISMITNNYNDSHICATYSQSFDFELTCTISSYLKKGKSLY